MELIDVSSGGTLPKVSLPVAKGDQVRSSYVNNGSSQSAAVSEAERAGLSDRPLESGLSVARLHWALIRKTQSFVLSGTSPLATVNVLAPAPTVLTRVSAPPVRGFHRKTA